MPDAELHPELVAAPVVLAATDPAQPYGAADAVARQRRAARRARPARWSCCAPACRWRGSTAARATSSRSPPPRDDPGWAEALAVLVKDGRARSVEVRKLDGEAVAPGGEAAAALRAAGFTEGYRGFVVRG